MNVQRIDCDYDKWKIRTPYTGAAGKLPDIILWLRISKMKYLNVVVQLMFLFVCDF
jgi:hypothetical protein